MSWRRLWVLFSRLPPDSATAVAMAGRSSWDTKAELLARICDELMIANWQFWMAHRGKQAPQSPPDLTPRPRQTDQ
jgi:hypothetical protein